MTIRTERCVGRRGLLLRVLDYWILFNDSEKWPFMKGGYVTVFAISQSFSASSSFCRAAIFPGCNSQMTNGCLKSSLRGLLSVSALCACEYMRAWMREKRGQVTSAHPYWFIVSGTTWGKHFLWRVSERKWEHDDLPHHLKVVKPSVGLLHIFMAGKKGPKRP